MGGKLVQIPHPPEEGWIEGSAPTMMRKDHHRALSAWARQLGPVYAIRIVFWHVRNACISLQKTCCMPAICFSQIMPGRGPPFMVHSQCWQPARRTAGTTGCGSPHGFLVVWCCSCALTQPSDSPLSQELLCSLWWWWMLSWPTSSWARKRA